MDEFPLHSQLPLGKSLAERRGAEQRAQLMSHQHKGLPWKMWTYLGSIEERWPPEVPGCSLPRSELKLIRGLPKQPSKNQKEAPGAVCKKKKLVKRWYVVCLCAFRVQHPLGGLLKEKESRGGLALQVAPVRLQFVKLTI